MSIRVMTNELSTSNMQMNLSSETQTKHTYYKHAHFYWYTILIKITELYRYKCSHMITCIVVMPHLN